LADVEFFNNLQHRTRCHDRLVISPPASQGSVSPIIWP